MGRVVLVATALALASVLGGCGQSSSGGADQDQTPKTPPPTEAEMHQRLTALPAPYSGADLANGEAKFQLCASCHTITPGGPNMTGPNLAGVVGRKAGSKADFNYSDPMKTAGFTWDADHLDKWVTNPRVMLPGTKMTFVGLPDAKDRVDVIAYLMVNSPAK